MANQERRRDRTTRAAELRARLNDDQRMTLSDLERFGCELRFVRQPLFQEAVAVVIDGDRKAFSVLRSDGSVESNPDIKIRI